MVYMTHHFAFRFRRFIITTTFFVFAWGSLETTHARCDNFLEMLDQLFPSQRERSEAAARIIRHQSSPLWNSLWDIQKLFPFKSEATIRSDLVRVVNSGYTEVQAAEIVTMAYKTRVDVLTLTQSISEQNRSRQDAKSVD